MCNVLGLFIVRRLVSVFQTLDVRQSRGRQYESQFVCKQGAGSVSNALWVWIV